MQIEGLWPVFICGFLGAAVAELARWYRIREAKKLPDYATSLLYWVTTLGMVLAGGGLAVAYGIDKQQAILAVNIGLSAPLIIQQLVRTGAPELPVRTEPEASQSETRKSANSVVEAQEDAVVFKSVRVRNRPFKSLIQFLKS